MPRNSRRRRGRRSRRAVGHAVAGRIQPPDRSRDRDRSRAAVPPVAAMLASADLRVRVDRDDRARRSSRSTGEVLRPGVNRVPLLSGATLIEAHARTAGRLPLIADGTPARRAPPGPGPVLGDARMGRAAHASRPAAPRSCCRCRRPARARATIDLPGEQADVRLSSGPGDAALHRQRPDDGRGDARPGVADARCGGRCATARRWPPRAKCACWPT